MPPMGTAQRAVRARRAAPPLRPSLPLPATRVTAAKLWYRPLVRYVTRLRSYGADRSGEVS